MSTSKNDLFLGGLLVALTNLLLIPLLLVVFALPMLAFVNFTHGAAIQLTVPYWEIGLTLVASITAVILVDLYLVEEYR